MQKNTEMSNTCRDFREFKSMPVNLKKIKTMKAKIIFISCLAALLSFSSCESFLTEENRTSLTADPFFTSEVGYESLVNTCYTPLRLWYGREDAYGITETGTDLFTKAAGNTNTTLNDYDNMAFNGTNGPLTNYWKYLYRAINSCNAAINRADKVKMNPDLLSKRVAEVRFLRAFYYWHIVETWGSTHFTTDETIGVETTANKTSPEKIYQQIFADLDACISSNLPEDKHSNGRVTKWAAKALKARLSLTRASATNNPQLYTQAANLAKEVIGSGKFSMMSDYRAIWSMSNANGQTNPEVIWHVEFSDDHLYNKPEYDDYSIRNGGHNGHLMFCMKYDDQPGLKRDVLNGRPFNRFMPTRYFVEMFDATIDQRWEGSFKQLWLMNNTNKGAYTNMTDTAIYLYKGIASAAQRARADKRYQLLDLQNLYGDNTPGKINRLRTFQLSKFDDPTRESANEDRSVRDAFVFRISEMYLIAAEALSQSAPTEALDFMNQLRRKRAIPGKENQMEITQAQLTLDFILDERARELGGEQLRWFDLKRTNKLVERVKAGNPDGAANIKEWHINRPIPRVQLDAVFNKDEFTQNDGYSQ